MAWFDDFNLPGATIDGYFGFIQADGPDDDDHPDVALASGWVTFKATTPAARVAGAWLGIEEVRAQIFEGQIVISEEDSRPVRLLATDAPIGVADWAWTAKFDLDGFTLAPLTFKAPRGTIVNLTADLIPIKSRPYQIIEGASIVDSESDTDAGLIRFKLSDGTYTRWVPGVGEKGEKGDPGVKGDRGDDGAAATITMGSVTAGATADVWMTGTPQARELHAVLPRGQKGDRGEQGLRGPAGPSVTRTAPGVFTIEDGGRVTEIHAFDPDDTPSPGAQAALDGVAATIPDATTDQRGMMTARAVQDLARLSAEPLSRRALQDALRQRRTTGVSVIFAGSSTIQGHQATSTDRRPAQRISSYLTSRPAQTAVSGSAPASGVQVWAWGVGGSTSASYLSSSHYTAVGSIGPVLMVHMIGSNDWSGSRTPAQYETSMRSHLSALKAASPDTAHLLVGQHQRNSPATGSHPWEDYTAVLRTLAEEDPERVEFLDLWPRYAVIGIPGADPWGWLHSDGIHLTDGSYKVLADWLAEHLGIPTPSGAPSCTGAPS
ncbi:GDSL-type esterase/lipase family protein [Brachybacterium sp. GPGPB12]|uniref:SGNH/GDSL hydrolase family protein n=1 Tax=Brachybacterium sp. GPGPB12 TaxID=3023517 RepID=UPI00313442F1